MSSGPTVGGRRAQPTPLAGLRIVFFAFSMALALISLVVVPVLAIGMDTDGRPDPAIPAAAVFVLGLVLHVAARLFSRPDRYRACRSPAELLAMFRVQFMLQLALAEAAALFGFVGFMLSGSVLPFVVGAAWTALGFFRMAPAQRRLQHLQDEIALQGCPYQLLDVLQDPAPAVEGS